MKNLLLLSLLLISQLKFTQAQNNDTLVNKKNILNGTEVQPQFPNGGEAALLKFLKSNIKYPVEARDNGIEGLSYVQFVIEKDGKISNAKVLRSSNTFLDNEALRLVSLMPDWIPGMKNGEKVAVHFNLPINFKLEGPFPLTGARFYNKGMSALKENNFKKAISFFDKAINKSHGYVGAYYNRGIAHHKLNHKTEACQDWNKCKELGDSNVDKMLDTHCK